MIRSIAGASLFLVVAGCETPPLLTALQVETGAQTAGAAADQLFQRLSAELAAAMAEGGTPAAVGVCKERAPAIAAEIEAATGVDIARTAPRVRNPANAPDAWEKATMASFVARRAAGEAWSAMTATQIEGRQLRWMRPIPLGGMCVACHGETSSMEPQTLQALDTYYPGDLATGFAVGELRGAFTARVQIP